MEIVTFPELGLAGLLGAIIIKALDVIGGLVKNLIEESKQNDATTGPQDPGDANDSEAIRLARANGAKIDQIQKDLARVLKCLDGNGRPGLVENFTKVATLLDAHISDQGLHK